MASWTLIGSLILSTTISLVLMIRVVRSNRSRLDKIGGILLLLVPFVGPLLYWFVYFDVPPQHSHLQNRGPRGHYTHNWLAIKPILEEGLRRRGEKQSKDEDSQDGK